MASAQASPRRKELLARNGFNFEAMPSAAAELTQDECPNPVELARQNAVLKAAQIAAQNPTSAVLGADTIVVLGGTVFGKPSDKADALRMLRALRGKTHSVFTAVAVVCESLGVKISDVEESRVSFKNLADSEIESYIEKVNVLDKAGAYAAQEFGGLIIEKIDGDFENVMGLPCSLVKKLLKLAFKKDPDFFCEK